MILSFLFFLLAFVVIGVLSVVLSRANTKDYLVAGQSVQPWLVALSAVATNNSGYMFIGMIGFTYMWGLSSIWLMVGWVSGDFLASMFIHRKLRIETSSTGELSYTSVLSRWNETNYPWVRILGGIITVLFLGTYAAAQLKAGSKALYVLFGWDYSIGAILGSIIVVAYCLAGGIRASIWTDAAQSFVMVVAMLLLCLGGIHTAGGLVDTYQKLTLVSSHYMDLLYTPAKWWGPYGVVLFVIGWLFAGFGVVGQPHIMVRFMAMRDPNLMRRTRFYYYAWYVVFNALTICVGLISRLLIPEAGSFDSELALPLLAQHLFPPVLIGLILAGLFAATMSTADSQILSCTASITRDFSIDSLKGYWMAKFVTFTVTGLALSIALVGHTSVFHLVILAWSALASAFAPLLTVNALGGRPSQKTAVTMMLVGLLSMLAWYIIGLSDFVVEVMPGIITGFIPYLIQLLFGKNSHNSEQL